MRPQRQCIVVNMRSAIALIVIFVLNGIKNSETASGGNQMDLSDAKGDHKDNSNASNNNNNDNEVFMPALGNMVSKTSSSSSASIDNITTYTSSSSNNNMLCPFDRETPCDRLQFPCIRCSYNYGCYYGREVNVTCEAITNVQCQGERTFQRQMSCRYCYQTELWQQSCLQRANCNKFYRTNCTVHQDVLCLGNRSFTRNLKCNWTQGYRWSTALLISLTLGGFGADRFYLGHWQEGIGKLFSFGGLGVWTIIDVLLISMHYLGPADGSLYI
ncbi:GL18280 [Drosophila persimilis]|uniref:TM2 domain-containing protein almondex n=2 Tax=pseudoobscura subgroup TaxID=32358 RepID=A0A6I8UFB9_DROPS|nr:TM2 domain-containing protein almondex [Drosophila pseudoobscura]XP_002025746.1 TM2 domain-containing protein almondex [Drosophila persimilis]EDW32642.1 GL18280 [Drosophila persimilis]